MPRSGPARTAAETTYHRSIIAERYLRGVTQADIAAELGINQSTVSRDLTAIQAAWVERTQGLLDTWKAEQLARIDTLERTYWTAWEASQADHEVSVTEQVEAGEARRVKAQVRREGQAGDPRYLAGVQWCISERCKILGLYAPVKGDVTSGGSPLNFAALMQAAIADAPSAE